MAIARKYKIGLVQMSMGPDPDANLESAVRHVREAAQRGAKVVCLPELFRAQYFCQREDLRLFDLAEPIPGPSTKRMGEVARELKISIVASLFERRAAGLYHNTAVTLGSDGSIISVYRKMHIPDDPLYYEKYYFTPGDLGFKAVDTDSGRIGTLVCWDQWYPEGARLTALQGAEVLFYPTAIGWHPSEKEEFGEAQYDAWQTIQRAHAIANGVYVAGVNRVGHENGDVSGNRVEGPGLQFWGGSFLADPFGRVIAKASHESEEILIGEVDVALMEETRRNWPFLRDRRIDAYSPITKRYLDHPEVLAQSDKYFRNVPDERQTPVDANRFADELLRGQRVVADQISVEKKSGIYAFFLRPGSSLPRIGKVHDDLIYIGMTKGSLSKRNPLSHRTAGSHSIRRTLGALLKDDLKLHAIARSDGNIINFCFGDDGEERLTSWMKANLAYACIPIEHGMAEVELALINLLCPPLNLTVPANPYAPAVKRLRAECQAQAARSFGGE